MRFSPTESRLKKKKKKEEKKNKERGEGGKLNCD